MPRRHLQGILLAAGRGSRYRAESPHDKLLVPSRQERPDALPVALASLRALRQAVDAVLVVIPAGHAALAACFAGEAVELLPVRSAGLGDSLAQAVAHLAQPCDLLVALADMPYVQPETVERIAAALDHEGLVVPTWQGRRGHPRGIGGAFAGQLLRLHGDRGAQALFDLPGVCEVAVDDPGIVHDIDRPTQVLR